MRIFFAFQSGVWEIVTTQIKRTIAGCGILVEKERECGIRNPIPNPGKLATSVFAAFYECVRLSFSGMRIVYEITSDNRSIESLIERHTECFLSTLLWADLFKHNEPHDLSNQKNLSIQLR